MKKVFCLIALVALNSSAFAFEKGVIALVQYNADLHFNDYSFNMQALTKFADLAVVKHANIVIFPEGSAYGYDSSRLLLEKERRFWCKGQPKKGCLPIENVAEAIPNGKTTLYWEEYAKKNNIYVLYNLPEKDVSGKYYNTTGVVGPSGYITKYRKRSLYWVDSLYGISGKGSTLFKTPFGNFGLITCADVNQYSYARDYIDQGANAIFLVTDWDDPVPDAKTTFTTYSNYNRIDMFASDVSEFDGTGKYLSDGSERERYGLPKDAENIDGISFHILNY
ncbi:MAG: carbon-nitrogen hydrolase family protein [Bdellovibrionales bacterium]|nr:carbon-nitrogen hydrolase family protein [Bdellovibrionales bacterium]